MKKVKKIRFVTFEISRYGGIIAYMENSMKALKELGYDVDIIVLTYTKNYNESGFKKKLVDFESGNFERKLKDNKSQNGGYIKSEISGYWFNTYYGYHLPPKTNQIACFAPSALEDWHKAIDDVDLLLWNFMPTKQRESEGFSDWPKFFDLPKRNKQVFLVHDAYFDVRNAWVTSLKDKISFLACAHIAGYNCTENISIPRELVFNPRYFPKKVAYSPMSERDVDFFAAHVFKSMKKMEDLLRMAPYLKEGRTTWMAGSGIELYYMMAKDKLKEIYKASKKTDPDLDNSEVGKSSFDRAVESGLEYLGLIPNDDVCQIQRNAKFSIDPSYAKHYAQYSRTHINGFIIEAVVNGSYPVLRDYGSKVDDILFDEIRAIKIPHDSTPKQFAEALEKAMKMSEKQYKEDIEHNFNLFSELFSAKTNMSNIVSLVENGFEDLPIGKDSAEVIKQSEMTMRDFFKIELPIDWQT